MVKRLAAIVFLWVFLLNVAGAYLYFFVRLRQIRAEMHHALTRQPTEQLERLLLLPDEFVKARVDEHEIKLNGRMYDIARVDHTATHVVVYALHDSAEDNLLSLLDAILKNAAKDKKPVPGMSLAQWMAEAPHGVAWKPGSCYAFIIPATRYLFSLSGFIPAIISPPPRSW